MNIPIKNIIRASTNNPNELSIITFMYDGLFDIMLANAFPNHIFYGIVPNIIWDNYLKYIDIPPNLILFTELTTRALSTMTVDAVICHDKMKQFDIAKQLTSFLHVPLISIEHIDKPPQMRVEDLKLINTQRVANFTISISNNVASSWGYKNSTIIPYGFSTYNNDLNEKQHKAIWIGKLHQGEYDFAKDLLKRSPIPVTLIGDNPELSTMLSWTEIVKLYRESDICIHIAPQAFTSIPTMTAMENRCAIFALLNPSVNNILTDDVDGIICSTQDDMIAKLKTIGSNKVKINELGNNAKTTIRQNYPLGTFVDKWTEVFNKLSTFTYTR